MSRASSMSTDDDPNADDFNLLMNISPEDPSTSKQAPTPAEHNKSDRIIGRQVRKGRVFYEVMPAAQFGFTTSILEAPSRIAPFNIAKFEYEYHNKNESMYPIAETLPDTQPTSIRWFGKLDDHRYFLIEYDNQTQRLIEMNDSSNSLDAATRNFVCKNLEYYLRNAKIDIHGNEFPVDPEQPSTSHHYLPPPATFMASGPSTSNIPTTTNRKEKVCTCMLSKLFHRAKPKLCLSKLESLIRRKKGEKCGSARIKPSRKHSDDDEDPEDAGMDEEKPPKKLGRFS